MIYNICFNDLNVIEIDYRIAVQQTTHRTQAVTTLGKEDCPSLRGMRELENYRRKVNGMS